MKNSKTILLSLLLVALLGSFANAQGEFVDEKENGFGLNFGYTYIEQNLANINYITFGIFSSFSLDIGLTYGQDRPNEADKRIFYQPYIIFIL